MKMAGQAIVAFMFWCAATSSAPAAQMAASCASLMNVSTFEAHVIYYQARADLGTDTANRLWAVYHRLKNRCAGRPAARIVVDVEPRVKTFLEAHR
jgi:hypothetical protein